MVLHIPYTLCRSGTYYYNRHVPKHAVEAYGAFIRQASSKCPEEAEGCCQTNANSSQFPGIGNLLGCADAAPLGKSGGAVDRPSGKHRALGSHQGLLVC